MGDKPTHRLIKRKDDGSGWETIGAAWVREKGGYNVQLELVRGQPKIKCLLVENNEEKKSTEPAKQTSANDLGGDHIPF